MRFKSVLLNVALTSVLGLSADAQGPAPAPAAPPRPPTKTVRPVTNFVTVTDQIIQAPKPENWLIYRGNYQGWGTAR